MANLEPIEESDLNLEGKFKGAPEQISSEEKAGEPALKVEKEGPKEVVAVEKDNAYGKILSKIKTQTQTDGDHDAIKSDADAVYQKTDAESQIQHLVDLATTKGVIYAVKVARRLEDNYVLDMFHDKLLVDEFHDALLEKGLIKEIQ
jgi:hypothetical protein